MVFLLDDKPPLVKQARRVCAAPVQFRLSFAALVHGRHLRRCTENDTVRFREAAFVKITHRREK
nr:MAG TPA: hypothetical protein [Caudoviricetes sp.]